MSISRVDSATEADWGFVTEDGDLHRACILAAKRASREFDQVEFDDAYQDAILFLAVRPDWQEKYRAGLYDGLSGMVQNIYSSALKPSGVRGSNRALVTKSREALIALELGGAS